MVSAVDEREAKDCVSTDVLAALPASWSTRLAAKTLVPITTGMSGAFVFRVIGEHGHCEYLKVGTDVVADVLRREVDRTAWLASVGVRVPQVVAQFADKDLLAVVMSSLGDRTAEDIPSTNWNPPVTRIAQTLARLHSLPVLACPFDETLEVRLGRARALVGAGEIDPSGFDERNIGVTPGDLYARLEANIPPSEDCVVTHGDATLSNLILGPGGHVGFVDCSHSGRADRYVDLSLLVGELEERFGVAARGAFTAAYGDVPWDGRKAEFYQDLYELF
jgi:aminoglycoside 3'-phosphotransferase-2